MSEGIDNYTISASTVIYKPGIHLLCPACNTVNSRTFTTCVSCGTGLFPSAVSGGSGIDMGQRDTASLMRSHPNLNAFYGYYAGLGSIIPVIGLLLGPVAIVLGILGLSHYAKYPKSKGRKHSLTGIMIGSLAFVANLLIITILLLHHK